MTRVLARQDELERIRKAVLDDGVAPALASQATQLVFGTGNPDADVVFIGEAPGKAEDQQGTPFVGASGKFLDEMLASIGLQRQDVYITNIVKYRPPENRDPTSDEKNEFLPYLQRQLEVIAPKVVVTLGRHSTNCFLPDLQISQVHGQPQSVSLQFTGENTLDIVVVPLYHPAAALYNGSKRQMLIDDFSVILKVM